MTFDIATSYLTMAGESLRTVQTLLGYKSTRMTMTERYSHLSPEPLKRAVQNLKEVSAEEPDEIKSKKII